MISKTATKSELFAALDEAQTELLGFLNTLDEHTLNKIPYEKSWTAGQVVRHITKSINGMAKAMAMKSSAVERDPGERIPQLQKTFLDFSTKMNSPEFIIPEEKQYGKQELLNELNTSLEEFKQSTDKIVLTELVEGLPLGPVTKLEILHFVLYHTQRHLNQLKKIYEALETAS